MNVTTLQLINFLIIETIIIIIILAVFLIKLILDLTGLVKSIQNLTAIIKPELEPTLKEFRRTLLNINSIAASADSQVVNFNKSIDVLSNSTGKIYNKAKIITASLKQGLITSFKVLMSKKK